MTTKHLLLIVVCVFFASEMYSQVQLPDVSNVTGAVIDESGISNIYYVKQNGGNDQNPGKSVDNALLTIKEGLTRALADLKNGIKTKVLIYSGVYRESAGLIDFGSGLGKTTLLVLEGAEGEDVQILGSELMNDGWTLYNQDIWQHDWGYDFGNESQKWDMPLLAHRSEMLFVNGEPYRQRILEEYSQNPENLQYETYTAYQAPESVLTEAATFGVAERTENGNKMYVRFSGDVNPENAQIEVAIREQFVDFTVKENLVIRNLTLKYFRNISPYPWAKQHPIQIRDKSRNLLVENCNFIWNNMGGFGFPEADNVTLRNNKFNYNGGGGLSPQGGSAGDNFSTPENLSDNLLFEGNETNFNGWRMYYSEWSYGAVKTASVNGQIIRNHVSVGNLLPGFWWDIGCRNVYVEHVISLFNSRGLFVEISNGPTHFKSCLAAFNIIGDLRMTTSNHVTFENNIVYTNIHNRPDDYRYSGVDFTYYPRWGNAHFERDPVLEHPQTSSKNNIVLGANEADIIYHFAYNPSVGKEFDKNDYFGEGNMFYHESGNSTDHFNYSRYESNGFTDFGGWLANMGTQEVNAQWKDPEFEDAPNFDFRLKSTSPLKDKECDYHAVAVDAELLKECKKFFEWIGLSHLYKPVPVDGISGGATNCEGYITDVSYKPKNESVVQVFPNPVINEVTFLLPHKTEARIIIIDLMGKVVCDRTTKDEQFIFQKGNNPSGIYLYKVFANQKVLAAGKLVVLD